MRDSRLDSHNEFPLLFKFLLQPFLFFRQLLHVTESITVGKHFVSAGFISISFQLSIPAVYSKSSFQQFNSHFVSVISIQLTCMLYKLAPAPNLSAMS
jgi:hypothetical protein